MNDIIPGMVRHVDDSYRLALNPQLGERNGALFEKFRVRQLAHLVKGAWNDVVAEPHLRRQVRGIEADVGSERGPGNLDVRGVQDSFDCPAAAY